ncbi:MAG: phytanoyl-CoA dioxygenase family protein [Phycisphaeraceae bacterium]
MAAPTTQAKPVSLTDDEVRRFHEQGYLGPYAAFTEQEMAELRPRVEQVLASDPPDHDTRVHNRHLDTVLVHELATTPAVLERMKAVMGEDLLLWRTNFFVKEPGAKEIPWHQDMNYWPIEPAVVISAWMAIDPATKENSCPQLIPGTHRKVIPHVKAGDEMVFKAQADGKRIDTSQAIDIEMKPGEFFLFNERTLHHSEPNRSDKRRIGLAIRVVPPIVRFLDYDSPNHGAVVISGRDTMGFNRRAEPVQA